MGSGAKNAKGGVLDPSRSSKLWNMSLSSGGVYWFGIIEEMVACAPTRDSASDLRLPVGRVSVVAMEMMILPFSRGLQDASLASCLLGVSM